MNVRHFRSALLAVFCVFLASCAWDSPQTQSPGSVPTKTGPVVPAQKPPAVASPRERAVQVALAQLGKPYRYGGASPSGFDCSGLVWYSYGKVGINVPRTTGLLWQHLPSVPAEQLSRGDVLFFNIEGKPSHVGLYLGQGEFVHAPSSGKTVTTERLTSSYYAPRLLKIGRIDTP